MRSLVSPATLARSSAAHPWRVVIAWAFALVASVAMIATLLSGALTAENGFTRSPESQQAHDLIAARGGQPDRVVESVIVRPATAAASVSAALEQLPADAVTSVGSVQPSRDGTVALIPVVLSGKLADAGDHAGTVIDASRAAAAKAGATALVAGQGSIDHDTQKVAKSDLSTGESLGIPVALIILLLVFGAVVSALLPVMLAVVAIVVSLALTALVGQAFDISFFVTNMITMMGLAVGIDYVLFIVSRYREERAAGLEKLQAIERSGQTASRAVLFSGITVVVALVGMLIVPTTIFVSLGTGAILVVLSAVAAAMTLLPAVLSLLGDRIEAGRVSRLVPSSIRRRRGGRAFWPRAVAAVMRRPVVSVVAAGGLLLIAAIPYLSITTGSAGVSSLPTSLQARQGFDVLQHEFTVGRIAPAEIPVTGPDEAHRITAAIAGDPRFGTPVFQGGVLDVPVNADPTSPTAMAAVRHLRTIAESPVGGQTSNNIDYVDIVNDYLPIVVAVVLGLSFLVLLLAFRSIVVPLVAMAMNLLSVGAAYGILVLVAQDGFGSSLLGFTHVSTVEAWIPLFLFSVLFGLSMDYHVFLLSRIRERWDMTHDTEDSITHGITSSARLITGAAAIMVAVFGGFAAGQLVMFQQMGFGLAVAVLIDATIVRTVLVPATMKLLGRWNWYLPRSLGWLPHVAVEGEPVPATA
jgi:putative drug exporter of the RND superfamily